MESEPSPPENSNPDKSTISLEQLRSLLLRPDRREVEEIKRKVEARAIDSETLSKALPDAVVRSAQTDHKLAKAMAPPVEEALQESIRRNPKSLAELLFPVIGPAIRRAVVNALQNLQETINQKLETTVSFQSIRWRLEASRTKVPYAQVVMSHVLQFRVTHVFLIHGRSGLLLEHVAAPEEPPIEPELIASMLKAILSFARESFGPREKEQLDQLRLGEFNLMVENGPGAILAVTVQGYPSPALRATMADALETVHLEHNQDLRQFNGDTTVFAVARPLLEACLIQERVPKKEKGVAKSERNRWAILAVLLALVLLPALWFLRLNAQWTRYRSALVREPGITVLESGRAGLGYYVRGFRDPLSRDPVALRRVARLPAKRLTEHWEYYASGAPPFLLTRARQLLQPPPTIRLVYERGTLFPVGEAGHAWLTAARRAAPILPGGAVLSLQRAVDGDRARLASILAGMPVTVPFSRGATLSGEGRDALNALAKTLRKIPATAGPAGQTVRVSLTGMTDERGTEAVNLPLRRRRASRVKAWLVRHGVPAAMISVDAAGPGAPPARAVRVAWTLSETGGGGPSG